MNKLCRKSLQDIANQFEVLSSLLEELLDDYVRRMMQEILI